MHASLTVYCGQDRIAFSSHLIEKDDGVSYFRLSWLLHVHYLLSAAPLPHTAGDQVLILHDLGPLAPNRFFANVSDSCSIGSMGVRTIEQKMDDSNVWDGAAPAGDPVLASDMESFAEGTAGGLFDFGNDRPIMLKQMVVKFGSGTTSWTISLVDKDDVEVELASVSDALPFFSTDAVGALAGLILLEGQKLKLVSAGGPTTASRARVSVQNVD